MQIFSHNDFLSMTAFKSWLCSVKGSTSLRALKLSIWVSCAIYFGCQQKIRTVLKQSSPDINLVWNPNRELARVLGYNNSYNLLLTCKIKCTHPISVSWWHHSHSQHLKGQLPVNWSPHSIKFNTTLRVHNRTLNSCCCAIFSHNRPKLHGQRQGAFPATTFTRNTHNKCYRLQVQLRTPTLLWKARAGRGQLHLINI